MATYKTIVPASGDRLMRRRTLREVQEWLDECLAAGATPDTVTPTDRLEVVLFLDEDGKWKDDTWPPTV